MIDPIPNLNFIAQSKPKLIAELSEYDPIRTVSAISGLMIHPELQSNSYRLETLAHIAMAVCNGHRKPQAKDMARWYSDIGDGHCSMMEDPSEDVFVFNIMTPRGNFLVLEGLWLGGGFILQHVINSVENMPNTKDCNWLRDNIYALLTLSNEVCRRANLHRYQLGTELGVDSLPLKIKNGFLKYKKVIKFTTEEILSLGIDVNNLRSFGFDRRNRDNLLQQSVSFSNLGRKPVCFSNNNFYLMIPNAVSSAIRRFVFEQMSASDLREKFVQRVANEYTKTFSEMPVLGAKVGVQFTFQKTPGGLAAETGAMIDVGHHLHIIMIMDDLDRFEEKGLGGHFKISKKAEKSIEERIRLFREQVSKIDNFKSGITLLVGCGIGRSFLLPDISQVGDDWDILFLDAYDFHTLSWLENFEPISLWRLNEAQEKLASSNVKLMNINGLLNLIAWKDSLDGHLVPHGKIPDDYTGDRNLIIPITQNGIRNLREKVFNYHDFYCLPSIDGKYTKVRKLKDSLFEKNTYKPIYIEDRFIGDGYPIAYSGEKTLWWSTLIIENKDESISSLERWRLLSTWFPRIAAAFESLPKINFPKQIHLELICETVFGLSRQRPLNLNLNETRAEVERKTNINENKVTIRTTKKFEDAFCHPENIAERAIVEACISSISELLGGVAQKNQEQLISKIITSVRARQTHVIGTGEFRDYVRPTLPAVAVMINNDDVSTMKFNLGWQARSRKLGGKIEGKDECTAFLNSLTIILEEELCEQLSGFNRLQLAELIINNHETAAVDRRRWQMTSASILALHDDERESTLSEIINYGGHLNAVFQACRVLLEIAPHECPLNGGKRPSNYEYSKLMAKVMQIISLGGWSDAIRWDATEPKIEITPLGDVYGNQDFFDNVVNKFGSQANQRIIENSVEKYESQYREPDFSEDNLGAFEPDFIIAIKSEIGISLEKIKTFKDLCEDSFKRKGKAFLFLKKSECVALLSENGTLAAKIIEYIIDAFTFNIRSSWRAIPDGFRDSDRQPWKFRRRLSVLRKPIVAISDEDDPLLLVAPGIITDALGYMIESFYLASFAERQIQSEEMKEWAGRTKGSHVKFNKEVAIKLEYLGWETRHDLNVTELLNKGSDENFGDIKKYGDIDVFAWSKTKNRVLVLECKDVQFKKTPGEIAEQLSKFRGENDKKGKPDLLRKHLNRIKILNAHHKEVFRYTGLKSFVIEGHMIFKDPVPMQYASDTITSKSALILFDEIETILKL